MKVMLLAAGIAVLTAAKVFAQDAATNSTPKTPVRIIASEAKAHLGETATVTGKIAEVHVAEKIVQVNFEQPYPKQVFTAVIFGDYTNTFPEIRKLAGKRVSVTGKIVQYRDRAQIVLTATNQLSVIEGSVEPAKK